MRLVLVAIQMLLLGLPLSAQTVLDRYVAPDVLKGLTGEEPVIRAVRADGSLGLLPLVSSRDAVASEVRAANPVVAVEVLRVLRGLRQPLDTQAGRLELYNQMHAVSTMKGIMYWSASRKERRVLFTESFPIASPKAVSPVADPVFTSIPAEDTLYTFQQDKSYGKNSYIQRFSAAPDHLLVRVENVSAINVVFIPVIPSGGFVTRSILIPVGRDLVFYGVSYIRTSFPIGDRGAREQSLANRLIAMSDWLRARLS
ncbi:MAG: hypothetical protein NT005_12650 [Spirochaetes bacterium]|nr:hypothetical protein [Spirochaetota bacterium]